MSSRSFAKCVLCLGISLEHMQDGSEAGQAIGEAGPVAVGYRLGQLTADGDGFLSHRQRVPRTA